MKTPVAGPVATIPRAVLEAIGGRSSAVRLSAATAEKQARRHPDLVPADYAKVQLILDEGELFRKRDRELNGFIETGGCLWRVAIKTTRDGAEAYLATFHAAKPRALASAKRRLRRIERGGE